MILLIGEWVIILFIPERNLSQLPPAYVIYTLHG